MSDAVEIAPAGIAFDRVAEDYDNVFTFSAIGRSQRAEVWRRALEVFSPGSHILELNCGTGEDALFLANAGMAVTACDASSRMIARAARKISSSSTGARIELMTLPTEALDTLTQSAHFDGVFSNFSGLNCVRDLHSVAQKMALRLQPGAPLLLCFSTRFCLWESLYFLLRANPRKAARRWKGISQARIDGATFPVYYPTLGQLRRSFAPGFRLVAVTGIGIAVTPSYLESWINRYPRLLGAMEAIDRILHSVPGFRVTGDHMLLHFERVS
jgi:ubiquinone/menaquinone biosynthesis C-methylase UbiE